MFFLFIIMNEIFIILKDQYSFINLIFKDFINEFYFYDKKYNFTFINKKCLKIYDSTHSYLLSTNDSFIFYDSEIKLQDFKIINLIHNEWWLNNVLSRHIYVNTFFNSLLLSFQAVDYFIIFSDLRCSIVRSQLH